ncbi:hypothetical protein MNBD_GAMMA06-1995 [hydrothermal vent metagenome]|uniref:Porin domain-containing protein n=1 Tax=hydrothermal vent metagenome TaxID=652676 RepID=A0A3B0WB30_9ZZZZ
MKKQFNLLSTAIIAALASSPAQAIQFDGFMTVGAAKIVDIEDADKGNVYIGALGDRGISNDLSFEKDTRFGIQISSDVTEDMSVVAQVLGRGDRGNFNAIIEWAYIDYEFHETTSVHVGKIKQPVYLVNDYVEVGYAYPWIRPPSEVYLVNNPLNTVNGIELLLQFKLGPGTLSLQPYLGSNREEIPNGQGAFFEAENIYGMDIKYSGRGYTAHASNFRCDVKTTGDFGVDANNPFQEPLHVTLAGSGNCNVSAVGFNFDLANIVFYSEWTKRTTTEGLSRPFGNTEAYYATLGYRFGKWLPHITFASIEGKASTFGLSTGEGAIVDHDTFIEEPPLPPNLPVPGGSLNFPVPVQTSITAGLRYEVNDSAALKFEYKVIDVEQDFDKLVNDSNQFFNYGLFNTNFGQSPPQDKVGIASIALDVIF